MEKILTIFPSLTESDVRSVPASVNGPDVWLSQAAQDCFPIDIECKNQERKFGFIYQTMEQATQEDSENQPVLIIKQNYSKPLAIMDAEYFFELMENV